MLDNRVTTIKHVLDLSHRKLPMALHLKVRGMRAAEGWAIESVEVIGLFCTLQGQQRVLRDEQYSPGFSLWWRWLRELTQGDFALEEAMYKALDDQEREDDVNGKITRIG